MLFTGCSEKGDTENSEFRAKWTADDRDAPKTVQILVCQERQSGLYTGVCKDTPIVICLLMKLVLIWITTENDTFCYYLLLDSRTS